MAPPTLIPGILFAGSLDGHLRAHDTRNGQVIWDFDTAQDFKTTNGVHSRGGSLNGAGPAILNSMLFVNTGYTNAMAGMYCWPLRWTLGTINKLTRRCHPIRT